MVESEATHLLPQLVLSADSPLCWPLTGTWGLSVIWSHVSIVTGSAPPLKNTPVVGASGERQDPCVVI